MLGEQYGVQQYAAPQENVTAQISSAYVPAGNAAAKGYAPPIGVTGKGAQQTPQIPSMTDAHAYAAKLQKEAERRRIAAKLNAILQPEDTGADVQNVQRWLEQLGYLDMSANLDNRGNKQYGTYGGATRAAVMFYQFNHGLETTGILDGKQYLDIYNRYLQGVKNLPDLSAADSYWRMVNRVRTMDSEKGYPPIVYPAYKDFKRNKPSLSIPMREAGVKLVYQDGLYYLDYTEPLMKMLQRNIREAEQARTAGDDARMQAYPPELRQKLEAQYVTQDQVWFFGKVAPERPWDIKWPDNWNKQFPNQEDGVKFFHQAFPFIFAGRVVTAEDMGNILYGATGTALGLGEEYLKWVGATPNLGKDFNLFRQYFGDDEKDLAQISYGVKLYYDLQARGSTTSAR